MYLLEDRILFDGAAAIDVAEADQQHEQQNDAAAEALTEAQEQNEANIHQPVEGAAQMTADSDAGSDADSDSSNEVDQLLQDILNSDNEFDSSVAAADDYAAEEPVNVLIVSSSLENAQDLIEAVNDNTS